MLTPGLVVFLNLRAQPDHALDHQMPGPTFKGRSPSSARASSAARGASRKRDTKCEVVLRRCLWASGLRYRVDASDLPGRPDIAFSRARVAVFCDGDFWHGRNWNQRRAKLRGGSNPGYWIAKIERNMQRDDECTRTLTGLGWQVVRLWELDILRDPQASAAVVQEAVLRRARSSSAG